MGRDGSFLQAALRRELRDRLQQLERHPGLPQNYGEQLPNVQGVLRDVFGENHHRGHFNDLVKHCGDADNPDLRAKLGRHPAEQRLRRELNRGLLHLPFGAVFGFRLESPVQT